MDILLKYLCVLGISMLPVLELRFAVPYGVAAGLPVLPVLLVSIIGNMIPVPFIILFMRKILVWMKGKSKLMRKIADKLEKKAISKKDILVKYETFGLFILVAIPLPGTGAWTGALIASVFDLRMKNAIPAIFFGVITAGLIMTIVTYGVKSLIM